MFQHLSHNFISKDKWEKIKQKYTIQRTWTEQDFAKMQQPKSGLIPDHKNSQEFGRLIFDFVG